MKNSANDEFLLAHLVDNANLRMGHNFNRGDSIAALVTGSFRANCGYAVQSTNTYHLHFGIQPSANRYQISNCILNTSNATWSCNGNTIAVGGWILNNGGSAIYTNPGDPDQPPVLSYDPITGAMVVSGGHIWDMPIMGLYSFLGSITDELPAHESNPWFNQAIVLLGTFFRLTSVFVAGIVNLQIALTVMGFIILSETLYWLVVIIRLIYKLIPAMG